VSGVIGVEVSETEVRAVWYLGGLAESFRVESDGFRKFLRGPDAYGAYRVAKLSHHLQDFPTKTEAERFLTEGAAHANRYG
jgi:hypothetical protein